MTLDPNQRNVQQAVTVAPSPATSGTDFQIDYVQTYWFNSFEQNVPFKISVFPNSEPQTKENSEVILVTAYTTGSRTGTVTATEVQAGTPAPGSVLVTELQAGSSSLVQDEIQLLTVSGTSGTYTLLFGGYTTSPLAYNASEATIQAALQGLTSIGSGNVIVGQGGDLLRSDGTSHVLLSDGASKILLEATETGFPYTITFIGAMQNTPEALITGDGTLLGASSPGSITVTELQAGNGSQDEVQQITINASAGTFTLTWGGQTTTALPWNIDPTSLETELQLLSSIGSGNIAVTDGAAGGPFTVEFTGALGLASRALFTYDASLLSQGGANEIQTFAIDADGGTFRLSADGGLNYTSALAYNASASTVQTALQGLTAVGSGNCTVSYDSTGGVYTVTFIGSLASTAVGLLTVDASSLTVTTAHITSCIRAQDNTTARVIIVTDLVEVVSQSGGQLGTTSFSTTGYTLNVDPTAGQVYLVEASCVGAAAMTVAYPSPNDAMASPQMFLSVTISNGGTGNLSISWPSYKFGTLSAPGPLAAGQNCVVGFFWTGLNWVAFSTNTF
jgi:hypothetical protein